MSSFSYKGYDASGRTVKGLVEAENAKAAREALGQRSLFIERLDAVTAAANPERRKVFGLEGRSIFYRELASLLEAGLPLVQAIDILQSTPEHANIASILAQLRDGIHGGGSFAETLKVAGKRLRPFEVAAIEVGERTGCLDVMLDRLATFLEEEQQISERVKTAMIYPLFILVTAILVITGLMGFMVPRFGAMIVDAGAELHWLTKAVMTTGKVAGYSFLPLLILVFAAALYFPRRLREDEALRIRLDRFSFRIPVWRKAKTALVNLRFARTLSLLLQGGVTLVDAMPLAGRGSGSSWTDAEVQARLPDLRHGQSLADVLRAIPPLSGALPGWVQAGEAGGQLQPLLERAAERYQNVWMRMVASMLALLEPVLILFVGLSVLILALAVMLPILSMNEVLL